MRLEINLLLLLIPAGERFIDKHFAKPSLISAELCYDRSVDRAANRAGRLPQAFTIQMTCFTVWVLVVLLMPLHLLLWATESRHTRIQRMRRSGATWKAISERYGCSPSTARRWSMA